MKARRFNIYRDGMEPESSGGWIRASDLPKEIQEQFVEPLKPVSGGSDDDEDLD